MKAVKIKLHHHRASKAKPHDTLPLQEGVTELWELDHDHPDPDLVRFSLQRSPKQENL